MESSLIAACIVLLAFLLSILVVSLGLLIRRGRGTGLRGSRGQYAGGWTPFGKYDRGAARESALVAMGLHPIEGEDKNPALLQANH